MKTRKLCINAVLLLLGLLTWFPGTAQATVTTLRYWRLGESDSPASNGSRSTYTVDVVGHYRLTNSPAGAFYPAYTTGVSGAAYHGAGSQLALDYNGGQSAKGAVIPGLTDNFGIELWVNPINTIGGKVIAYNGNTGSSGWGFYQNGAIFYGLLGGVTFSGAAPALPGVWAHLALVRSGGATTLYLNGVPSGTTLAAPVSPAGNFLIAANNSGGENFAGPVDEIRVFSFAAGQFSMSDLLLNGPFYSLGRSGLTEGTTAGSDSVVLKATPGTNGWTAQANASWLHPLITAGVGSTNFTFSFDANPDSTRSGTITIAGQSLTVIQAGGSYVPAGVLTTLPLVINQNSLSSCSGVSVDANGNIYAPNYIDSNILKLAPGATQATPINLKISGTAGYPLCAASDAQGNLYYLDGGQNSICKWTAATASASVLALTPGGVIGLEQLAVDAAGNVYFPDSFANVVYKLDAIDNFMSPLITGLNGPTSVAVDAAGNVYIAEKGNNRVLEWLVANDTVTPLITGLNQPGSVAVDGSGNVYVADTANGVIRKRSPANGLSTIATGLTSPNGVAVDLQGNVYTWESQNVPVKKLPRAFVDATPRLETGIAGGESLPPVLPAGINLGYPLAPAIDIGSGTHWLTNSVNLSTAVITLTFGTNNTADYRTNLLYVFGLPIPVVQLPAYLPGNRLLTEGPSAGADSIVLGTSFTNYNAWTATTTNSWLHAAYSGGSSTNYTFHFDANLGPTRVGAITLAGMNVTVVQAGSRYVPAGLATRLPIGISQLSLDQSAGLGVDGSGTVYVPDNANSTIKVWNPGSQQATNLVFGPSGGPSIPVSVTADPAGNLYILDQGNGALEKWTASTGTFTILTNPPSGFPATVQMAVDSLGNLYIPDGYNSVYKWNASSNTLTTLVTGLGIPIGVSVDAAGNLYIADSANHRIVKYIAASKTSYTLLGGFLNPKAVAVDGSGNVYVADTGANAIWKYTVMNGQTNVLPITVTSPNGVAVDAQGNVYTSEGVLAPVQKLPRAFVDPTPHIESAAAGTDSLAPVLPTALSLDYPFIPGVDPAGGTRWLTNTGVSGGIVNLAYGRNESSDFRTNTVYVLFQPIPVSQVPAFSAGVTTLTEGPTSGRDSVLLVSSIPGNPWTAASTVPWLHLDTTAGAGSTNLTFSFDSNPGPTRVGMITFANQSVTLTQAGRSYVPAGALTPLPIVVNPNSVGGSVGLSVDPQGNVYVPDYVAGVVKFWRPGDLNPVNLPLGTTGQPPQPVLPTLVTADAAGNLYLLDGANNALEKWSPLTRTTSILTQTPNGVTPAEELTIDSAGNLYFLDPYFGGVFQWRAADGTFNLLFPGVQNATGLAIDAANNLYVADAPNNRIVKLAPNSNGFTVPVSGVTGLGRLTVDGSGNLYFVDTTAGAIRKWSPATGQITTLATGLNAPNSMAVDSQGSLYTCESTTLPVRKLPRAFVDPTPHVEGPAEGVDVLAPVLPTNLSLDYPFTPGIDPAGDTLWLFSGGITDGSLNLSFNPNDTGVFRTNTVFILFQPIVIAQSGALPTLLSSKALGDGRILLSFTNLPTANLSIRSSTNLSLPLASWSVVGSATNVGSNLFQFAAPIATNGQMFFQATSP